MHPITLRPYQQEAVEATLAHFRQQRDAAVLVLPTGAGKSLVIAELARRARGPVLVLAHVTELVEQNHQKLRALQVRAGIYAAGLKQRDRDPSVICASIQSLAPNLEAFQRPVSLLIIDECHRVSLDEKSQYQQVLRHFRALNPELCCLGLTATPYRLGEGWIYQDHYRGFRRSETPRPFQRCIYELPISQLIRQGYLTAPQLIDRALRGYDFSSLIPQSNGEFSEQQLDGWLGRHPRVTRGICEELIEQAQTRRGAMIFAATVKHAQEIHSYLPTQQSALITAQTSSTEREEAISRFRAQELKFLVNVAVLTTGFDVPHVDLIAILRPTQSVSLFQQMAGRGLRLAPGKTECLILDYAGNGFSLNHPEVGSPKPASDTEPVQVFCPACGFANLFWGRKDASGQVIEHFGRRCQGLLDIDQSPAQACDYRFRFRECPVCAAENDITSRQCHQCAATLIDPDDQLKKALQLKDARILRCAGVTATAEKGRLRLTYHGEEGETLSEWFDLQHPGQCQAFNQIFGRRYQGADKPTRFSEVEQVINLKHPLPAPDFVIARRRQKQLRIDARLFDYVGRYRKANCL
ncbi:DEAD/DEAH box helicase [Nitrincola tapanii]|uniref:DEAD/DEAH box helicase n=1 Tax=Nitrincola tapanii TaxID=1708751 RepID=A0A5A9W0P3_9GAMM|nr:DEAD/DEAH box helicase [Nitrincola tapanii]KAA0874132.1 DEAD/DEAH box helicase [Nitrincola tapanii]